MMSVDDGRKKSAKIVAHSQRRKFIPTSSNKERKFERKWKMLKLIKPGMKAEELLCALAFID